MSCCTSLASYIDKIPTTRRANPASKLDSQWLTLEHGTVRYIKTGNVSAKETVILMPDPPNTIEHMEQIIDLLKTDFQVIAFEGIGFGFSSASYSYDFSLEHNADTIIQLLEKLEVKRAILALTCVAALSALLVANKHPSLISGLVLGQTPSLPEAKRWAKRVDFKGIIGTPFVGQIILKLLKNKVSDLWFKNALPKGKDRSIYLEKTLRSFRQGAHFSLASGLQAILCANTKKSRLLIRQNTIVLWGELDRSHKKTNNRDILDLLPNGKLIELPNCGHFPDIEAPKAFAEAIFEVSEINLSHIP